MARIFVTGSADGLGRAAASALLDEGLDEGHDVVVHVRSQARLSAVKDLVARGAQAVVGDLADLAQTHQLADRVNAIGPMDAVIHNAGVYESPAVLAVNVVAPYVLTALIPRPPRLIYLSSGMHRGGRPKLEGLDWTGSVRRGSYSDSKLFLNALAAAVARLFPGICSHSVDPGWVPTKMGGPSAPDDLRLGHVTQVWLATTDAPEAKESGYWHHQRRQEPHPATHDEAFQGRLLEALAQATGVVLGRWCADVEADLVIS
jgi:NAD(P)-dependent dehydrogenase (short-subunit alcohol dehydrogenase family)